MYSKAASFRMTICPTAWVTGTVVANRKDTIAKKMMPPHLIHEEIIKQGIDSVLSGLVEGGYFFGGLDDPVPNVGR